MCPTGGGTDAGRGGPRAVMQDDGMTSSDAPTPRQIADRYVDGYVTLDPLTATALGLPLGADAYPDLSPEGLQARADLQRRTLADLDAAEAAAGGHDRLDDVERRCATLLRERLEATLALHDAGDDLRSVDTLFSTLHSLRSVYLLMPTATDEQWATVARRMAALPAAVDGYRTALAEGVRRGRLAAPRQVDAVVTQLGTWLGTDGGPSWFAGHVAAGPQALRGDLDAGAAAAADAVAALRDWLRDVYAPAAQGTPDPVGRERYARWARYWTGSDLDLEEAYAYGWSEFRRLDAELRAEAERVLPGATPREAMAWLSEHGEAVDGVDAVRAHLQDLMDGAIAELDGTHFDLAGPVRVVEAMIAPPGSAAAPYYTRPSLDFSRPGRTWLPTLGKDRFPLWDLVSTWYHEGVPGHHLQLAQWVHVAPQLSRYQTSLGSVGANVEGWALYAERLRDELGYLTDAGARIGYLDAAQMRAVRVVVDIGMHLELEIPAHQGAGEPFHPGERWTPELAREFFGRNSGRPEAFLDSELLRYLGMPGQAISYKLGERAWLAGRAAAQAAHGADFDAKAWHMAALSQGSLGLDDLVAELSRL